jgi:hypothetical protein
MDATPRFANTSEATVTWNTAGPKAVLVTVATSTCTAVNSYPVTVADNSDGCIDALISPFGALPKNTEVIERYGVNNAFAGEAAAGMVTLSEVTLYPNPFTNKLYIRLVEVFKERARYQITNTQGKLVKEGWLPPGTSVAAIDLSAVTLSSGLYFIVIDFEGKFSVHKKAIKH